MLNDDMLMEQEKRIITIEYPVSTISHMDNEPNSSSIDNNDYGDNSLKIKAKWRGTSDLKDVGPESRNSIAMRDSLDFHYSESNMQQSSYHKTRGGQDDCSGTIN